MHIIKLSATDSTNDYLKQMHKEKNLKNYTVVTTLLQAQGKGQMGTKWFSETGKNLTFSILVKNIAVNNNSIFDYNVAVSVSILEILQANNIPHLSIKWPNDIMAENKKVGGILIENNVKADGIIDSIIGIGLNVNQENFDSLPQATSLKNSVQITFDLDNLLIKIVSQIQENLNFISTKKETFWSTYSKNLFKMNTPIALENQHNQRFMGVIKGVTKEGKLTVILEDDSFQYYGVKDVKMLY